MGGRARLPAYRREEVMDGSMFRDAFKGLFIVAGLALIAAFGLGYACSSCEVPSVRIEWHRTDGGR